VSHPSQTARGGGGAAAKIRHGCRSRRRRGRAQRDQGGHVPAARLKEMT
jgi:hypothetical protein